MNLVVYTAVMSGNKAFEAQIAALDALRDVAEGQRMTALRKALGQRNNFLVAKAAGLVGEFRLADLIPDLLKSFDRFFENPVKSDPQCWAKNAISRALAVMEQQDEEVFLRGARHIQLEPVWGGSSDTAGTLRATCAFALVQCRGLREPELLAHLVDMFGDSDKSVRAEVARAIEQVGSTSAGLLLRQRAVLGNDEPEVLGACYGAILRLEGVGAIPWISRFIEAGDDAAAEAALAVADTRSQEGFEALRSFLVMPTHASAKQKPSHLKSDDPWFRSVILSAIALTRQEAAVEFLLDLIRQESRDAEAAMQAILHSRPSDEIIGQLEKTVDGNPRLVRALAAYRESRTSSAASE